MAPPETLILRGQYDAAVTVKAADSPYHVQPTFPHQILFVDTDDDDVTIVLPESPAFGTMITIVDVTGTANTGDNIIVTGQPDYPAAVKVPNGIDGSVTLDFTGGRFGGPQYKSYTLFFYGRSPAVSPRTPIPLGYRILWDFAGISSLPPLAMDLAALTLAAILALPHPPGEDYARSVATVIADAAHASPLWQGDAGEAATAAILVGIGYHETGLRERLARCLYRGREGDNGRSLGLFQLQGRVSWGPYSREELCSSDERQAERALAVLHIHAKRAKHSDARVWLNGYATGNVGSYSVAGTQLYESFLGSCRRFKLLCMGIRPEAKP